MWGLGINFGAYGLRFREFGLGLPFRTLCLQHPPGYFGVPPGGLLVVFPGESSFRVEGEGA